MRRRVDCFPNDHPGYHDWVAEHPQGFVLTITGPEKTPVLQRADCPHVRKQPHSGPSEKRCAPKRETLEQWVAGRRDVVPLRLSTACVKAGRLVSCRTSCHCAWSP